MSPPTDWFDWTEEDLEDEPEMGFLAYAQQRGKSRGENDWWTSQFAPIFKQYQGMMARQIAGGQAPGRFTGDEGFMGKFDWGGYRAGFTPEEKGLSTQPFAPQVRWY